MAFYGVTPEGTGGHLITIEAVVNEKAPTKAEASLCLQLLGLPGTPLKQAVRRWESALASSGLAWPNYEVIINLRPANLPKKDTTLEAPIVALLAVLGHDVQEKEETLFSYEQEVIDTEIVIEEIREQNAKRRKQIDSIFLSDWLIIGELSLKGELKSTRSLLGMLSEAPEDAKVIVPQEAKNEASLLVFKNPKAQVFCASNIKDVVDFMLCETSLERIRYNINDWLKVVKDSEASKKKATTDLKDISGQDHAKRALEIAVAGGHSLLLFGPPGEGKNMLAEAVPGIMPKINIIECYEINQIYSAKGLLQKGQIVSCRPFRKVHSSASIPGILGGKGNSEYIEPGEVSLAHHGVLFLDELLQFPSDLLESLRGPLEDKKVVRTLASGSVEFLCNFALIAAMNPCKCGYYGEYKCSVCLNTIWKQNGKCDEHPEAFAIHMCHCSKKSVDSYLGRLSGPFSDRFDLKVRVHSLNPAQRFGARSNENSSVVIERIKKARIRQAKRFNHSGLSFSLNSQLKNINEYWSLLELPDSDHRQFDDIQSQKSLSTRQAVKALQVARTIADLEGKERMSIDHILHALGFMSTSFNETAKQIEMETSIRDGHFKPIHVVHLKNSIVREMSRRRLKENHCAREMKLSVPTLNKVLRGESNLDSTTIDKIMSWLKESQNKSF